jgi:tetratricopeptide (TPR) repeat protein
VSGRNAAETTPPGRRICRLASSCEGSPGRHGQRPPLTRGAEYLARNDPRSAARAFSYAVHHHPSVAESFLNRAIARERMGQWGGAIRDYREYLRLSPDAEDRQVVAAADVSERHGRGGVAGHHEQLDVLGDERVHDLEGVLTHLVDRPRSVRAARRIAEIDQILVGQQVYDSARDGKAANTRVEYPDGARCGIYHHSTSSTCDSAVSMSSVHACVDRYFQPASASKHSIHERDARQDRWRSN